MTGSDDEPVTDATYPIRTEHLTVRLLHDGDVDALTSYRNDPEVSALQDWELAYPRERAERLVTFAKPARASAAGHSAVATSWVQAPGEPEPLGRVHLDRREGRRRGRGTARSLSDDVQMPPA